MATKSNGSKDTRHVVDEKKSGGNGIGGQIRMSEDVVATIAGMAARDIGGIYALGKSRLMNFGSDKPTRGVAAEVGQKEAALDLEVIIEHGCDIRKVADELRHKVADQVQAMAGRKVVEVNLDVVGVHLPDQEEEPEPVDEPRVR